MALSIGSAIASNNFRCRCSVSILERNGNKPPYTYNQFQGIIESMDPPPLAVSTITPDMIRSALTPLADDHDDRFGVPSLDELGR